MRMTVLTVLLAATTLSRPAAALDDGCLSMANLGHKFGTISKACTATHKLTSAGQAAMGEVMITMLRKYKRDHMACLAQTKDTFLLDLVDDKVKAASVVGDKPAFVAALCDAAALELNIIAGATGQKPFAEER